MTTLLLGDCLDQLKTLPDNSVDSVVTDPPYGLSKEPDIAEVMRHWLAGDAYTHKASGFMGKSWDSFVPGPEYWREVFRVLKPGGHAAVFAGTRTWDLMSCALRFAGFENRDTIGHGVPAMAWAFGSGFPKSLNVSKAIDRAAGAIREESGGTSTSCPSFPQPCEGHPSANGSLGGGVMRHAVPTAPATDAAKKWDGYGTALKPAWEVILLFRKPLASPTVAANVQEHGTGAINIDGCRIEGAGAEAGRLRDGGGIEGNGTSYELPDVRLASPAGRWPSNLLLTHSASCEQTGMKKVKKPGGNGATSHDRVSENTVVPNGTGRGFLTSHYQADGTETVPAYNCATDCPVRALDAQSGTLHGHGSTAHSGSKSDMWGNGAGRPRVQGGGESGGASRFFPQLNFDPEYDAPFLYQAKAGRKERNEGCEELPQHRGPVMNETCSNCGKGRLDDRRDGPCCDTPNYVEAAPRGNVANHHPTVKPVALMQWLCLLITPPSGTILDPFMGSGTTGVSAVKEGFSFIGIEREPEYMDICKARIAHAEAKLAEKKPEDPQRELFAA